MLIYELRFFCIANLLTSFSFIQQTAISREGRNTLIICSQPWTDRNTFSVIYKILLSSSKIPENSRRLGMILFLVLLSSRIILCKYCQLIYIQEIKSCQAENWIFHIRDLLLFEAFMSKSNPTTL